MRRCCLILLSLYEMLHFEGLQRKHFQQIVLESEECSRMVDIISQRGWNHSESWRSVMVGRKKDDTQVHGHIPKVLTVRTIYQGTRNEERRWYLWPCGQCPSEMCWCRRLGEWIFRSGIIGSPSLLGGDVLTVQHLRGLLIPFCFLFENLASACWCSARRLCFFQGFFWIIDFPFISHFSSWVFLSSQRWWPICSTTLSPPPLSQTPHSVLVCLQFLISFFYCLSMKISYHPLSLIQCYWKCHCSWSHWLNAER